MNLLIAAILFLFVTACMIFMLALARRGRKKKKIQDVQQEADPEEKTAKSKKKKQRWGVDKDAYCYPHINDVMGFEFVKVIKVEGTNKAQAPGNEPATDWEHSKGVNGLRIVSSNDMQESNMDEPFPEERESRPRTMPSGTEPYIHKMQRKPYPLHDDTSDRQDDEPMEHDLTEEVDFPETELDYIQQAQSVWGPSENRTLNIPDEQIDMLINENSDLIETPRMDDEQVRIAEEIENMEKVKRAIRNNEEKSFRQDLDDIMHGDESYVPTEDDIPDID